MSVIIDQQFRDAIESELKARQMSRSDLARAMGRSPQYVCEYLNGRKTAGPDVMEQFFAALGLVPRLTSSPLKPLQTAG